MLDPDDLEAMAASIPRVELPEQEERFTIGDLLCSGMLQPEEAAEMGLTFDDYDLTFQELEERQELEDQWEALDFEVDEPIDREDDSFDYPEK